MTNVVEFLGEGGEAVTVTIATGDDRTEDAELIETAKQMLVQVIAFDRPDLGIDGCGDRLLRARNASGEVVATCTYEEIQLHDA